MIFTRESKFDRRKAPSDIQGMFKQKTLGHGSWKSLNSYWLRVSRASTLGLHEGNFGLHSITFSVDENFTWYPTWQVSIMLFGIVGIFLFFFFPGKALEDRLTEFVIEIGSTLRACALQNTLSYNPRTFIWSQPENRAPWPILIAVAKCLLCKLAISRHDTIMETTMARKVQSEGCSRGVPSPYSQVTWG